jgi:thiol-disulfide isomerase/thioredoxin
MSPQKSKRRRNKNKRTARLFVLSGILILAFAVVFLKEKPQNVPVLPTSSLPAETQLDQALQAGLPVLAFFHSNTCDTCIRMMDIVARVYPQYEEAVVLVDVNVYDEQNEPLMRRVRLQYIPTQIFYDRSGAAETRVGVMVAAELSSKLDELAGGP